MNVDSVPVINLSAVKNKYTIYASNLHVGGGVQVAASVIDEFSRNSGVRGDLLVQVSTEVHQNLVALGTNTKQFDTYLVEDHHRFRVMIRGGFLLRSDVKVVFVIFGPAYKLTWPVPVVMGFAQPWIIYPDNELSRAMGFWLRLKTKFKYAIQSFFFRRSNVLVVELAHVKKGLVAVGVAPPERIHVVENCLSAVYFAPERWSSIDGLKGAGKFRLGFVGRNYAHKNTAIFPAVKSLLLWQYGLDVDFFVTFNDDEWVACESEFRRAVYNVGPLKVTECPSFYRQLDGVVFPSLLECFSATPLEAMAMKRALFVSDRPFNRDVCAEFAEYFDPLRAESVAEAIAKVLCSAEGSQRRIAAAYQHVLRFADAEFRAQSYIDIMRNVAGHPST